MKKVVFLVVVSLFLVSQYAYAENIKVGVVDLLKALNESDSGKKAKGELEGVIKAKQVTIDEKGKEIEKLKGELDKQSSALTPDAKKSREEELERLMREYQRLVSDAQADVKKRESEMTNKILKDLRAIIEKIGQDEGYTMILENAEGVMLYHKKSLDLTDTVIKKYNASKAKEKK